MTKQEAKKLANRIINLYCKLLSKRREDITLRVNDDDSCDREEQGSCGESLEHGFTTITLNVNPYTEEVDFIDTVCHELGHVFTAKYRFLFNVYVLGDIAEGAVVANQIFIRDHEEAAKDFAVFFGELWRLKKEGKQ
jgi:hypothetical protein